MLPYSTQCIDDKDIEAVTSVLRSPYLTTGPKVPEFEQAICAYTGAAHACAMSSATAALHISLLALGIKPGDIVYVSAISFVASSNCALYCNASVEFVDVNKDTGNLDIDALTAMLSQAKKNNTLPKALVCVHLSGRSCDMKAIHALSKEYGFAVVEDASHALGASYDGSKVGCCRYSDITVFSLHPVKIITTAEGGLALTNNADLAYKLQLLRSHGITHDKEHMQNKDMPSFYYEQCDLGYNYRMTDMQAALGLSQLTKLDDFVAKRSELARNYLSLIDIDGIELPVPDSTDNISSWHLFQIRVQDNKRDALYTAMRGHDIGVQVHYLPIYRHPYYQAMQKYAPLAGAESFFSQTLSIPLFVKLTKEQQIEIVIANIKSLMASIRQGS